jgi:hypothetical protein
MLKDTAMGKAILGFLAILIFLGLMAGGALFASLAFMIFKYGLLLIGFVAIIVIAYFVLRLIGHILVWIFRGFRDFKDF